MKIKRKNYRAQNFNGLFKKIKNGGFHKIKPSNLKGNFYMEILKLFQLDFGQDFNGSFKKNLNCMKNFRFLKENF